MHTPIHELREAERARFTGRVLAVAGAEQVGGAVFSQGRIAWAIHRAQADNLGTYLERLGPVSRQDLARVRRAYDASDKRASFASMLDRAKLVPQAVFWRCLLLHNRGALEAMARTGELKLTRRPGPGPAENEPLFSLEELMTDLAPEVAAAERVERWRALGDENRVLAPLSDVPGLVAAAVLSAEGQVVTALAPDGVPDAGALAATLAGLAEAAGRTAAHSAMGNVQYVLVAGETGTVVARWANAQRTHLVCALVAGEHQVGMAKYRINAQLGAVNAWLGAQEP